MSGKLRKVKEEYKRIVLKLECQSSLVLDVSHVLALIGLHAQLEGHGALLKLVDEPNRCLDYTRLTDATAEVTSGITVPQSYSQLDKSQIFQCVHFYVEIIQ